MPQLLSNLDRDMMIRTIIGEADDESPQGQAAVAHVIMNRMISGDWGNTPANVVLSPGQFEPWSTRSRELMAISPDSADYKNVGHIVDGVADGQIPDPTNGATYFLNPNVVRARHDPIPAWAQGKPAAVIGRHEFFRSSEAPSDNSSLQAIYDALGFYKEKEDVP